MMSSSLLCLFCNLLPRYDIQSYETPLHYCSCHWAVYFSAKSADGHLFLHQSRVQILYPLDIVTAHVTLIGLSDTLKNHIILTAHGRRVYFIMQCETKPSWVYTYWMSVWLTNNAIKVAASRGISRLTIAVGVHWGGELCHNTQECDDNWVCGPRIFPVNSHHEFVIDNSRLDVLCRGWVDTSDAEE